MKDAMVKLMDKKKDSKPLDENYKNAKMSMLQALHKEMSGMMADGLKHGSMKKVEVAAPDKASLHEGLEKADQLLGDKDGIPDSDEDAEDETADDEGQEDQKDSEDSAFEGKETPGEEEAELEQMDLSLEDIEKIEQILAKKKAEKMAG